MATDVDSERLRLRKLSPAPSASVADHATTPSAPKKRLGLFEMFIVAIGVVLALGVGATVVGLAGFAVVKGIDVLYSAEYLVEHWSDPQAIPANGDLCKGLFCRSKNTQLKHVAGSAGKRSETFAAFCPEHQRSDYLIFLDLSHLGTLMWYGYGVSVLICAIAWASLAGSGSLILVGSPALLLLDAERRKAFFGICATVGVIFGAFVGSVASVAYVWW